MDIYRAGVWWRILLNSSYTFYRLCASWRKHIGIIHFQQENAVQSYAHETTGSRVFACLSPTPSLRQIGRGLST
jgi:hypothetical protein